MTRLLVVSPVRNEAVHVEMLVRSVSCQSRLPDVWLVVDDGSDDGTLAAFRAAAAQVAFLQVLSAPRDAAGQDNEARLARAAEARAFNWGLTQVDLARYAHVAKLDGDLELPPHYFARVLAEFDRDPSLGVAGGRFAEPAGDDWRIVRVPATHVPGALKVYRRECLEAVGGLREHLGWDTIDETTARMRGFTTRSLPDLVARHHRPMGSVGGRLRGRARYGTCAFAAGYPASWVLLRSVKIAALAPRGWSGVAFLYGYARAALGPARKRRDPDLRRFVRAELRDRVLRRGVKVGARPSVD